MAIDLRSIVIAVDAYLPTALDCVADCPPRLREAMAYSLLAPGKRLRPALVLFACEAVGGTIEFGLPAAAAVEMVHTYSLIHDDLPAMDDDDVRRGRPTCHKQFGEAFAILAGDALLTLAFQVLAESYPPAIAAACCRELARGAGGQGMVGGQVEDLAWENDATGAVGDLEQVHARKTGAFLRPVCGLGRLSPTPVRRLLRRWMFMAANSARPFRLRTICWMSKGRRRTRAKRSARTRLAAS